MEKTTLIDQLPKIATTAPAEVDGVTALEYAIRALGHDPALCTSVQLQGVADKLSAVAGGGKTEGRTWTRSYLRQVLRGQQKPSARLASAAAAVLREIRGESPLITRSVEVKVRAVGRVAPGAVILGNSKPCANPFCPIEFVPVVPRQRYCSVGCRKKAHKSKAPA